MAKTSGRTFMPFSLSRRYKYTATVIKSQPSEPRAAVSTVPYA